ncbi:methyltransferase, partial [Peniophora sp. CONT]
MGRWPPHLPPHQNLPQALPTWQPSLLLARGAYPTFAPLSQARSYIRTRFLKDETQVWSQNAWDHVPPPADQREHIAESLARQRAAPVPEQDKSKYNDKPARHWDEFYKANQDNFFKKRKWLHLEFPELIATTHADVGPKTVIEFGCGTGSAIFPLLEGNANPELTIRAYDYSSHAIKLVQRHAMYTEPPAGASIEAAVYDVSRPGLPPNLEAGTADFVLLVFVLSALHPHEWATAVRNAHAALKPGGKLLMRDYGRHDMAQLRFRGGRLLSDNFYARGDKTRVYFFELDELALMFTGERA